MKLSALVQTGFVCGSILTGCDVAYQVGVDVDASAPKINEPEPSKNESVDAGVVSTTPVPTKGFPWPCERWGKGAPLTNLQRPLLAASHLFGGTQRDLDDVVRFYTPVLEGGRSGDFYCAVLHMLEDFRAAEGVGQFYTSWLQLGNYPPKDKRVFPDYTAARLELMGRDARKFAVDITLEGDNNFARLFTTARPIDLAPSWQLEQIKPDIQAASAGILSEPGVLATIGEREVSPTVRGDWLNRTFLCDQLPPPPANVITPTPASTVPGQSFRQRYDDAIAASPQCVSCHQHIDAFGYALDSFDVVGRLQPRDRFGQPFDTAGVATSVSGDVFKFSDLADVGRQLARSPKAMRCYVQNWLNFLPKFTGISPSTQSSVDELAQHLEEQNGQIKFLIAAIFESAFASVK